MGIKFTLPYRGISEPDSKVHEIWQYVASRLATAGTKTAYIKPGSPWENGFATTLGPIARYVTQCERFNGRLRDEFLNGEIFYSLREVQIIIESWRKY